MKIQTPPNKLPMIIPLVIYHGKNNWNISTTLGEMINGYNSFSLDIKKYIPNFEYLLYDTSRYKDEDIKGELYLRIALTIYRDISTKDDKAIKETILKSPEYLAELEDKHTGVEYFETLMRYIFSAKAD